MDSSSSHVYRRDGVGVTDPLLNDGTAEYTPGISRTAGTSTLFYGSDWMGSNVMQTDSSQNISSTSQYDAFGNLISSTGSPQGPLGFNGQYSYQTDSDSGFQLLGHRYYDPSTGRFLTRDPAKDGQNWFACCDNRVLIYEDASGLHNGVWGWLGFAAGFIFVSVVAPEFDLPLWLALLGSGALGSAGTWADGGSTSDIELSFIIGILPLPLKAALILTLALDPTMLGDSKGKGNGFPAVGLSGPPIMGSWSSQFAQVPANSNSILGSTFGVSRFAVLTPETIVPFWWADIFRGLGIFTRSLTRSQSPCQSLGSWWGAGCPISNPIVGPVYGGSD